MALGALAAFAAALAVFALLARDGSDRRRRRRAGRRTVPARAARRADAGAHRRAAGGGRAPTPPRADTWTLLAGAYLQRVRETGDAALLRARATRPCAARCGCARATRAR